MEFERKILNELVNKYERSNASKFDNAKYKKICLEIKDKIFDGKRNGSIELEEAIARIEKLSFCKVIYLDEDFSRIELIVDKENLANIYRYLNRSNPLDRKKELVDYLSKINDNNPIIHNLKIDFLNQIENGKFYSLETYYGTLEDLTDCIKALDEISTLDQDIPERIFSVKVFSDSKRFAAIRNKIQKIILDYSDEPFDEGEDAIAALGVIKNTTYSFIKGDLTIKMNNQIIDLRDYGQPIALSDLAIKNVLIEKASANALYTIENLTSFEAFDKSQAIIIYLGGFHNSTKRELITKIQKALPNLNFYHYGDIDAGGFYILNHLRKKTNIAFEPYMMGISELINHRHSCKSLTKNDVKRLNKMMESHEFYEFIKVIKHMLENNIKLEQEGEN